VDLVTAMRERSAARSRRGTARRRGLEPVAALPLDEAVPSPTTGPAEDVETIAAAQSTAQPDADPVLDPGSDPVPDPGSDPVLEPDPDPVAEPVPGPAVSAVAAEPHGEPEPLVESDDDPEPDIKVEAEDPVEAESPPARHTPRRSGRPSVPSWDDIVFGTKPKDPQP
jgi:hypothetical protein